MSTTTADISEATVPASQVAASAAMSERELAEIIGAFNEVTGKLHSAHEALRAEVSRLKIELREANEQVERSRRLAALGEMAAGIAHEVRNPLGSIQLYAKMLVDDLVDRAPERQIAEKIGGAVRGLDAVVGDVLAFSREMRVRAEVVDARELIAGAVDEGLCGNPCDVEIRAECGEIECDASLLHRALVNVIRNAGEAMREGGGEKHVTISTRRQRVANGEEAGREGVVIRVEDSGPGVAEDVLARMFNPFFTTRATGTGLGLAIVHRIVDAHGGRVVVQNVRGEDGRVSGASVELVLPMERGVKQNVGGRLVDMKLGSERGAKVGAAQSDTEGAA